MRRSRFTEEQITMALRQAPRSRRSAASSGLAKRASTGGRSATAAWESPRSGSCGNCATRTRS